MTKFIPWYNSTQGSITIDSPVPLMTVGSQLDEWFSWLEENGGVTPSVDDTSWSEGVFTWDEGCFLSKFIYDQTSGS